MAKLVRVCRNNEEDETLDNYQIPLVIDGDLKMIMQIPPDQLLDQLWDFGSYDNFMRIYKKMNVDELAVSFMVTHNEVLSFLSQAVPCVGCRQSVEKLYNHIVKTSQPALEPLHIMQSGVLTIDPSILKNPLLLHTFLYCRGSKLNEILESIPKCRRNRRCLLHSLETHKSRTPIGCWVDVWEVLSQKCQDEVLTINSDTLLDALENHLRKNRFCTECKRKVLKAFGILTGDIEAEKVKGYCPSLYEGLKPCPLHKHVHVPGDVDFLTALLEKAEHELSGMRRERHAKSMDTAQEEVLTCLAVFMWERLHHLWQKLRTEEQSWQMLYYLGINTLRRSFEVSVEEKQGMSKLEQVVEEIFEEEKVKEVKREQKRQKKRARRKEKCKYGDLASSDISEDCKSSKEGLTCEMKNGGEEEGVDCKVEACEGNENELSSSNDLEPCDCNDSAIWNGGNSKNCSGKWPSKKRFAGSKCGKMVPCSEEEGDKSCPLQGSGKSSPQQECEQSYPDLECSDLKVCPDTKEKAWNEVCNQNESVDVGCQNGFESDEMSHDDDKHDNLPVDDEEKQLLLSMGWNSAEPCQDDSLFETDIKISKEEIQHFKANRKQLINQRQKLREKLREQFNSLSVSARASR